LKNEKSKNLSLRLKLANDGDKTTLSGREFQVLIQLLINSDSHKHA